jgi:4-hydroxy-tetrahydrodipicolinate synthase
MMFGGSIVALVTPFSNGKVDEKKIAELVEFHIKNGTSGIVPCGTTGESATLSFDEHDRVIEMTIQAARNRIPIIAGTGSNSTQEAIDLTKHAKKAGANASLQVSPYYNRPTQRGLYLHFRAIAEEVDIPIILYNIASRTGVNIEPETVAMLSEIKNIVGIKEASGSLDQISRIISLCPNLTVLSGDDSLTLPIMAVGGKGVISVVANIVPGDVAQMVREFENGNIKKAAGLHYKLLPLVKAMFIETNPIPVKMAMGLIGMIDSQLRLPLCSMNEGNLEKLKAELKKYGLLK